MDKDTWLIDKGYDKFLGKRDPSTIPRVRQSYTVSTGNDPHGARGTRVRYESQADYDLRCKRYSDEDKRLWAKIMRGYCGAARATAMRAPKYKAQALLDLIQQEHGDKSAKQVSHLVRDFISSTKANIFFFCFWVPNFVIIFSILGALLAILGPTEHPGRDFLLRGVLYL